MTEESATVPPSAGPEPQVTSPADAEAGPYRTSWWALDVSDARPIIARIAGGRPPADGTGDLLDAVRIHDVDEDTEHTMGPFGGRRNMIGQPVSAFWPSGSRSVLADLIVAAIADFPQGVARSRAFTSMAFANAVMSITKDEAPLSDLVFVTVGGNVLDDRSLWEVRTSEERYRSLIQHLPTALLVVDSRPMLPIFDRLRREGVVDIGAYLLEHPELAVHSRDIVKVTGANRSAAQLFAADDVTELIGSVDVIFAASPPTAGRVITSHFDGVRSFTEVMKLRTFNGRLRDVELSVTHPTPPEHLDVTLLSFVDITERLRTDAQLRQLQADFSRAGRIATLGELAASIAHEVNQPLSAIVTNADTSLRWLTRDEPNLAKVEELTTRIAANAHRAHEIVQRIRAMAMRHQPERRPLDINEVIEESLLFIRHDVQARSLELSVALAPSIPRILGDRVQLQQVLVNLLLNAMQAIAQYSGETGRIHLQTTMDDDGAIILTIRDNGGGIAAENLDRVFDGFFTTREDGIGIGLAICQSIIATHSGRISASNHPDGGALFEIRLPADVS